MTTKKRGKFITIEGGDFSGKSTLINNLKSYFTKEDNFKYTREPGNKLRAHTGFNPCENIRHMLLNKDCFDIEEQAKLLAASREIHTNDIIGLINQGYNIICDRYVLSSFAYQGYAGDEGYWSILKLNERPLRDLYRNEIELNIILLKVSDETYNKRKELRKETSDLDVIESKSEEYFNMVNEFYNKDIYKDYLPADFVNVKVYEINADKSIEEVFEEGKQIINNILNK